VLLDQQRSLLPQSADVGAVIATYAIGKGDGALASSWAYVLPATLICLWFAAGLNIVGVGTGSGCRTRAGSGRTCRA
jgi:hypothetical protein